MSYANRTWDCRVYTSGMTPAEETELIGKARQGDVDAFCHLISRHQRSMYAAAYRFCGNHHDAEDLTQEVFVNAYRAIGRFRGMSSFQTWLRKIMLNSFLNHKRKSHDQAYREVTDKPEYISARSERTAFNHVVVQQVFQRLEHIPPRQRLMFIMKHQEGLTCEEIAEHFGTAVGTVKKTLFRIVEKLRREFKTSTPSDKEATKCTIVSDSVKI